MTVRKPTETMTVPARLFTGEGHFVEETWMAGLWPTPSLLLRSISFHLPLLVFLPRLAGARPYSNVRRRRTEADENRITCSELETGEERWRVTRCYGTRREESRTPREERRLLFLFLFTRSSITRLKISSKYQADTASDNFNLMY